MKRLQATWDRITLFFVIYFVLNKNINPQNHILKKINPEWKLFDRTCETNNKYLFLHEPEETNKEYSYKCLVLILQVSTVLQS